MKYKHGDGKEYEISYSQKLQGDIKRSLQINNRLTLGAIVIMVFLIVLLALIYFNTGIIGTYLVRAVC
jgi:hypothetical protein